MIELPIVDTKFKTQLTTEKNFILAGEPQDPNKRNGLVYTLQSLLSRMPSLPLQTAILGLGKDGLPLLFDLTDPRPGPILVVGETLCGKTTLLKTIVHSLILSNRPYEVRFSVVSGKPEQWKVEANHYRDYFMGVHSNYERSGVEDIMAVCDLVESRQHGRNEGPAILLLIDGFDTIPRMDFDLRLNFEWLLQEGPQVQIWPVVTMNVVTASNYSKWVNLFKTRLIGYCSDIAKGRDLSLINNIDTSSLEAGNEFAVRIGRSAMNFWLPDQLY